MALPINDTIVAAVAQLIDDSKSNGQYRDPTHSDIDFYVNQAGLAVDKHEHRPPTTKIKATYDDFPNC